MRKRPGRINLRSRGRESLPDRNFCGRKGFLPPQHIRNHTSKAARQNQPAKPLLSDVWGTEAYFDEYFTEQP